jgi:hypothetical protein
MVSERSINERAWDDHYTFWSSKLFFRIESVWLTSHSAQIARACEHFHRVSISVNELAQLFKWNSLVPMCLEQVVTEMKRRGKIADAQKQGTRQERCVGSLTSKPS